MGARIKGVVAGIAPNGNVMMGSLCRSSRENGRELKHETPCEGLITVRGRFGKEKSKPNPLAGFGGVGCGVLLAGKAPTATGGAVYRALAQSANSKRDFCAGKGGHRECGMVLLGCSG